MWKKDEDETGAPTPGATRGTQTPAPTPSPGGRATATIGSAITIKGEVSGDEDLLIEGRVEGSVDLEEHAVTIGADGSVTASITGRTVTIEGRVEGDIRARERVVLRASSDVQGDITSPRVVLEDGARFRGGVDMSEATRAPKTSSSLGGGSASSAIGGGGGSGASPEGSNGSKSDTSSSSASKRETAGSGKVSSS